MGKKIYIASSNLEALKELGWGDNPNIIIGDVSHRTKEEKIQRNIDFLTEKFNEAQKRGDTAAAKKYSEDLEKIEIAKRGQEIQKKIDKLMRIKNGLEVDKYYTQKLGHLQFISELLSIGAIITFFLLIFILYKNKIKSTINHLTTKLKNMKSNLPKNFSEFKESLNSLDNNDIIIVSIIIATLIASILGYYTGETLYFYNNGNRGSLKHHHYSEFHINYFVVIIGFITAGGLSYLFLKKNRK